MNLNTPLVLAAGAAANLGGFAYSSRVYFDGSHLTPQNLPFALSYVGASALAIGGMLHKPALNALRQSASCGALIASACVFTSAIQATRAHPLTYIFSPDRPQHLNQSGPYHYVRHPFYAAYLGTFGALALSSNHIVPLLAFAGMASVYTFQARREEAKFGDSSFSQGYKEYKQQAGLFFPRPQTVIRDLANYWSA